jgi:hypothetical protein
VTSVDPLAIAAVLAKILDEIGIRYVIGGSVAASAYGEPRTTLDIDMMIEADESQVRRLVEKVANEFYVDENAAVEAVRATSSFNLVHYKSSMKIDLFLAEQSTFATRQLERRRALAVRPGISLYFYAPEDVIIRKLMWDRIGSELSDRQWRDVIGVLKLSSSILDWNELRRSAKETGVEELLSRAITDAEQ